MTTKKNRRVTKDNGDKNTGGRRVAVDPTRFASIPSRIRRIRVLPFPKMVLLAAAVVTKNGKNLVTRQFVSNMTRSRLEGLLEAFPKLLGTDVSQRQHTFVETDSVRYVYQPLDDIYVVLVTTKASNILEDLEALRLFSRVVPEYCRSNDEAEILNKAFELIFAFDEIVALGYRENVNLALIRTFTEMDSHEERVHKQIINAQMRDATNKAQQRAKELKKSRETAMGKSRNGGISSATAISSSKASSNFTSVDSSIIGSSYAPKPVPAAAPAPRTGGKALKLGVKNVSDDAFVQQLRSEGQVINDLSSLSLADKKKPVESVNRGPILIRQSEKLTSVVSRNGGIESAEIQGSISVNISEQEYTTVTLKIKNNALQGTQIQVHPNMDKAIWQKQQILKLKSLQKPYPLNGDVGVIRWRLVLNDEEQLPLVLNVFPNETPDGCIVNVEYTLQNEAVTLQNVVIVIPLPPATQPIVSEAEGSYEYIRSKSQLLWTIPIIDESNSSGNLEFNVPNGHSDHFFPVNVNFESENLVCQIELEDAVTFDGSDSVEHSSETAFIVDKYEIV